MKRFTFEDILMIFLPKIWIIAICAIVAAVSAYAYCNFVAIPIYSTTATMVVTSGGTLVLGEEDRTYNTVQNSELSTSLNIITTYVEALSAPEIYSRIIDETKLGYTKAQLQRMTEISIREDSLIIDIRVESSNQKDAVKIANAFVDLAPDYLKSIIPATSTAVISSAEGVAKVFPNVIAICLVSLIVGMAIPIIIIFIFNMVDHRIKDENEITQKYDVPLLGTVPNFGRVKKSRGGKYYGYGK